MPDLKDVATYDPRLDRIYHSTLAGMPQDSKAKFCSDLRERVLGHPINANTTFADILLRYFDAHQETYAVIFINGKLAREPKSEKEFCASLEELIKTNKDDAFPVHFLRPAEPKEAPDVLVPFGVHYAMQTPNPEELEAALAF